MGWVLLLLAPLVLPIVLVFVRGRTWGSPPHDDESGGSAVIEGIQRALGDGRGPFG